VIARAALFAGEVVVLPASAASLALVELVAPLARAATDFAAVCALRARLVDATRPLVRALARDLAPAGTLYDALRLRVVRAGGHRLPVAARAYTAHRDTWFAGPQAQVNWWIPLDDVGPDRSLALYPRLLARPVANSSAAFDYGEFLAAGGFGAPAGAAQHHPAATEPFDRAGEVRIAARRGEVVLFAGAQLHETVAHDGPDRLSIDFRTVTPGDAGPPNVDSRARGSTLADFLPV
jgi:hypothetical protein